MLFFLILIVLGSQKRPGSKIKDYDELNKYVKK